MSRELHEETGITDVEMGPCVWTQYVEYTFSGLHFESNERIHVARCNGREFRPKGLEALEAAASWVQDGGQWTNCLPTANPPFQPAYGEFPQLCCDEHAVRERGGCHRAYQLSSRSARSAALTAYPTITAGASATEPAMRATAAKATNAELRSPIAKLKPNNASDTPYSPYPARRPS